MTPDKDLPTTVAPEWQPTVSGDAQLRLSLTAAPVAALQMDFEFKAGGGFAVAKQVFERSMPEEYAVRFRLRGRGAPIQLELKLVDPSGRNVWRHVVKDLTLPARWKQVTIESRDIEFAWGPAGIGAPSQLGSVEIAIVTAAAAKGTLWIADLRIENTLPAEPPTAVASSSQPGFEASHALAGPGWKPGTDDRRPRITVDFIGRRRLGGLIIDWLRHAPASGFRVRGSNTGRRWDTLYTAVTAGGGHSYVYLPNAHVRFLRLELEEPSAGAALRVQSFEFSRSIDAFWHNVASAEPRGWNPRWLQREQTVWTPLGTSHGTQCALMNADGMVEVSEGSFSIEPMLFVENRLFTWADVTARQTLRDDWMPVPSVIWETATWRLGIEGEATAGGAVRVRYRIENLSDSTLSARLFVLLRPFQVTPPWQSFRHVGGVSRIRDLSLVGGAVHINGTASIVCASEPSGFAALTFDDGFIAEQLAAGVLPAKTAAHDAFGFASGALAFDLSVEANGTCERVVGSATAVLAAALAGAAAIGGAPVADGAALVANSSTPVAIAAAAGAGRRAARLDPAPGRGAGV